MMLSADSGSDKSFDLLGVSNIIKEVKELIIEIWDRVVFYRKNKTMATLEVISNSLSIMKQIDDIETNIGPERAAIYRRKVVQCVDGFLNTGMMIPEINENSSHNPKQLLAPAPKLLGVPAETNKTSDSYQKSNDTTEIDEYSNAEYACEVSCTSVDETIISGLSKEETQQFLSLQEKMKANNTIQSSKNRNSDINKDI